MLRPRCRSASTRSSSCNLPFVSTRPTPALRRKAYKNNPQLGEWERRDVESCLEQQICRHCGAAYFKTVHTWSKWKRSNVDPCVEQHTCKNCDAKQSRERQAETTKPPKREKLLSCSPHD
jgi:hypothetical protein